MKTIDVGYVIDEGRWSTYQKLLILGTALTIILDGVDNQLLGNAVPSLMKEWSLPRRGFFPSMDGGRCLSWGASYRSCLLSYCLKFCPNPLGTSPAAASDGRS